MIYRREIHGIYGCMKTNIDEVCWYGLTELPYDRDLCWYGLTELSASCWHRYAEWSLKMAL